MILSLHIQIRCIRSNTSWLLRCIITYAEPIQRDIRRMVAHVPIMQTHAFVCCHRFLLPIEIKILRLLLQQNRDIRNVCMHFPCENLIVISDIDNLIIDGAHIITVTTMESLYIALTSITELGTRSMFYYTGHGTPHGIRLPSGEHMSFREYRNCMLDIFLHHSRELRFCGS